MAVLKSLVQFTGLVAGTPQTQPHGLIDAEGRALRPDHVETSGGGVVVTAADETTVTVVSGGVSAAFVLCERWHSIPRALLPGVANLAIQPFVPDGFGVSVRGSALTLIDSGTVDVFVDAVNGDDGNDGLTAATALQTLAAVYRRFPFWAFMPGTIVVHLADDGAGGRATYPARVVHLGGNARGGTNYQYEGPDMVLVTPTTGVATATLGNPAATTVNTAAAPAVPGTRTRLNAAGGPGWTADDLQGSFARVTRGGLLLMPEIAISKNTATQVFLDDVAPAAVVQPGDVLEIVTPGARIQGDAADIGDFAVQGTSSVGVIALDDPFDFSRLELDAAALAVVGRVDFDRCLFTFRLRAIGGRLSMVNCSARGQGGILLDNPDNAFGSRGSRGTFLFPSAARNTVTVSQGGFVLRGGNAGITQEMGVWDAGFFPAIEVQRNGYLRMATRVVGNGNAGAGIFCSGRNSVVEISGGADTEVTGTGGDLRVATGAAISYGTGAGQFQEAAGFNGNFTRALEGASAAAPTGDASLIRAV